MCVPQPAKLLLQVTLVRIRISIQSEKVYVGAVLYVSIDSSTIAVKY